MPVERLPLPTSVCLQNRTHCCELECAECSVFGTYRGSQGFRASKPLEVPTMRVQAVAGVPASVVEGLKSGNLERIGSLIRAKGGRPRTNDDRWR